LLALIRKKCCINSLKLIQLNLSRVEGLLTWLVHIVAKHSFSKTLYRFNFPEVWYSPWRENLEFQAIYQKVAAHTLISERKLFDLFSLANQVTHFRDGRVLEIGSYRGGSGALLAAVLPQMQLILWDNWGKPVVENSYFIKKIYAVDSDLLQAQDLVSALQSPNALSCHFVSDIFPNRRIIDLHHGGYTFVHFDIYDESAFVEGMALIWPKLRVGGIFVCGGYGAISLNGLTKEVNMFVESHDCTFIQSQSGLGVIIKR
jgi:O-methyltransferase